MNLLVNAQDAMPQGGRLNIETAEVGTGSVLLRRSPPKRPLASTFSSQSVTQESVWTIPFAEQVFDPFFTTKTVGKGTGLGLSTVYGIVKQHDGHIWVYSQPGLGTAFKLYFPIQAEAESHDETPSDQHVPSRNRTHPGSRRRRDGARARRHLPDGSGVPSHCDVPAGGGPFAWSNQSIWTSTCC